MGWTNWKMIADKDHYYIDDWFNDGAACYELAIGGPRGGNITSMYVGETSNEQRRIRCYATHGSHLSKVIDKHLMNGYCLYCRSQAKRSKKEAERMQNNLLNRYCYPWNTQLNICEID